MTALRLRKEGMNSPRHAVVGSCSSQDTVSHVGILEHAQPIASGDKVPVFHMANPLTKLELPGKMDAHALGWLIDLGEDAYKSIKEWVEELRSGGLQIKYLAFPSYEIHKDPATGRVIRREFSCAGFVQACYEEALQIWLLVPTDELPDVARDTLELVWERALVARGRHYGLAGPGPWKVLLPSYLFHALSKDHADLPHKPLDPDPYFRQ